MPNYKTNFVDYEGFAPPYKILEVSIIGDLAFLRIAEHEETNDKTSTRTLVDEKLKESSNGEDNGQAAIGVDAITFIESLASMYNDSIRSIARNTK